MVDKESAEKVIADLLLAKDVVREEDTTHYPTSMVLSLDAHLDLCVEFYTLEGVESEFKHLLKTKVITRKEYKDYIRKARRRIKRGLRMKRTLSERRHNRRKKINKRKFIMKHVWYGDTPSHPEGYYGKFNLSCNCSMCGNPRKHEGKKTRLEVLKEAELNNFLDTDQ